MTYDITANAPGDVKADLCRIWRDNLQDVAQGADEKFSWLYEDSPFADATAYLASHDDLAIGTCTLQTRQFSRHGHPVTAGLFADLAIDQAHRTGAPALQLLRRMHADSTAKFPFAIGFPNAKATAVFKRAGFGVLGQTQRYALILRHERYVPRVAAAVSAHLPPSLSRWVEEQTNVPSVQRWLGTAADWAAMALRATVTRHNVGTHDVTLYDGLPADDDDARADTLIEIWRRGQQDVAIASVRSLAFLRWRSAPWSTPFCAVLSDAEGPCAYALITVEDGTAHIRDAFGTMDGITSLLAQLPSLCYDRDLTSVSFRYLGAPWLAQALEAAGFSLRPETRTVVACFASPASSSGSNSESDAPGELTLAANWLITDIDEDT